MRLARVKRCCSFPHDQFLMELYAYKLISLLTGHYHTYKAFFLLSFQRFVDWIGPHLKPGMNLTIPTNLAGLRLNC
jgi:hypothetical protein